MGKNKASVAPEQRRCSARLAGKCKPALEAKKKPIKRVAKAKKEKPAENGNTKNEEPKAEATEAK